MPSKWREYYDTKRAEKTARAQKAEATESKGATPAAGEVKESKGAEKKGPEAKEAKGAASEGKEGKEAKTDSGWDWESEGPVAAFAADQFPELPFDGVIATWYDLARLVHVLKARSAGVQESAVVG